MAADEKLASRIRTALGRKKGITERKMFGGLAFLVNGHMACGVMGDGTLMVSLGNQGTRAALGRKHTRPMDFTGKVLRSMVFVDPAGIRTARQLESWIDEAVTFTRTLPPKQ